MPRRLCRCLGPFHRRDCPSGRPVPGRRHGVAVRDLGHRPRQHRLRIPARASAPVLVLPFLHTLPRRSTLLAPPLGRPRRTHAGRPHGSCSHRSTALGVHCVDAYHAMYNWAQNSAAIFPTIGFGYISWFFLLVGVVAVLRASGRGRTGMGDLRRHIPCADPDRLGTAAGLLPSAGSCVRRVSPGRHGLRLAWEMDMGRCPGRARGHVAAVRPAGARPSLCPGSRKRAMEDARLVGGSSRGPLASLHCGDVRESHSCRAPRNGQLVHPRRDGAVGDNGPWSASDRFFPRRAHPGCHGPCLVGTEAVSGPPPWNRSRWSRSSPRR